METIIEIVTDEELGDVWANANFGGMEPRDVVRYGLLKCACGYYQGHTSTQIITVLGLIDKDYNLTAKGRQYLWLAFDSEGTI